MAEGRNAELPSYALSARNGQWLFFAVRLQRGRLHRGYQHRRNILRRHGLAEQIALQLVASASAQEGLLFAGLDALGDDGKAQRLAHADDRSGDRPVLLVLGEIAYERTVDL